MGEYGELSGDKITPYRQSPWSYLMQRMYRVAAATLIALGLFIAWPGTASSAPER